MAYFIKWPYMRVYVINVHGISFNCSFNNLFKTLPRLIKKKLSKLCVTGPCAGKPLRKGLYRKGQYNGNFVHIIISSCSFHNPEIMWTDTI